MNDQAQPRDIEGLPGTEIVRSGLEDLMAGDITESSLLVLIAGPRLRRLGIVIPESREVRRPFEHELYSLLETTHGKGAYSRYNSLLRRIVSFSRALEHRVRWESVGNTGVI